MNKLLCVVSLVALLAACTKQRDVTYYKANVAERDQKISGCHGQPGAFDNDQECISAWMALDVQPVSYWLSHDTERGAMTGQCKEHAATLGKSANCENAGRAAIAAMGGGKPFYPTDK